MTIAEQVIAMSKNANEAIDNSKKINIIEETQDWKEETTTFEFDDKSKVVVNNSQFSAT